MDDNIIMVPTETISISHATNLLQYIPERLDKYFFAVTYSRLKINKALLHQNYKLQEIQDNEIIYKCILVYD